MLALYHNDMSVCAQKVRMALAELELDWEDHHLKLRGDEQLRPEYLRINPKGQVPAIVDGSVIVVESTVINEYLADSRNAVWLLPDSAAGRARMRWWTRQLDDDVHRSTGILSQAIAFRHQYLATGPDMVEHILKNIPEEQRRDDKRRAFTTGLDNPDLPAAARRMDKLFADMDASLERSEWLAGDRFTLADIGMTPYATRMAHLELTMLFEGRPHLQAWFARIKARPSYEEALVKWFNPEYLTLTHKEGIAAQPRIAAMLKAS